MRRLVVPLLLILCADLSAALPLPPEKDKWLTLTAGEFRIYSSASERETKRVVTALLRMREAVGKVTMLKVRSSIPVYVYLFRDERSFRPYRDTIMRRSVPNLNGVFFGTSEARFIALRADVAAMDKLVFHELTHAILENTMTVVPAWYGEGMAEYYSTFYTQGDEIRIGAPIPEYPRVLRESFMPLSALFAVDSRSPEYGTERRQKIFYAESWALVHYLMQHSAERRAQLGEFAALTAAGHPAEEAFRGTFGVGYEAMEEELRAHMSSRSLRYTSYTIEELKIPEIEVPQAMSRAAALVALGEMLLQTGEGSLADAETYFSESVRLDPNLAGAHAGLGFAYRSTGRPTESQAALERSIALGTNDSRVYVAGGEAIIARAGLSAVDVDRARKLFERATQLAPDSARAWAGLGATWVLSGDENPDAGIAALERSLELAPSQQDVAIHLVQLYARAGRREDARRIVDTVLAGSDDPAMERQRHELLLLSDVAEVDELLRAGEFAQSADLARRVAASTADERLRERMEAASADAARRHQVEQVNAAIRIGNGGNVTDALTRFDEILPRITDADLRARVQEIRDQFAAHR